MVAGRVEKGVDHEVDKDLAKTVAPEAGRRELEVALHGQFSLQAHLAHAKAEAAVTAAMQGVKAQAEVDEANAAKARAEVLLEAEPGKEAAAAAAA